MRNYLGVGPSRTVVEVSYSLVVLVGNTIFENGSAKPESCKKKLSRSSSHTVVEVVYSLVVDVSYSTFEYIS